MELDHIRNFSIVAHIDHGKSTLADRILEMTHTVSAREMREQLLDSMELERERGITIKAQAVRVLWQYEGEEYELNLIDTPGHVDFTYEVSRSLAACEGAILVVDAAQGLEAQTLANAHLAIENDLEIVPVLNKIDLPAADPDQVAKDVSELLGDKPDDVLRISAKTGQGIPAVLDAIIERVPPPEGDRAAPARALVFDSTYDQYRGVVAFVRVVDGTFRTNERVRLMATGTRMQIDEIGVLSPRMVAVPSLDAGEVGYVVTGIKDVSEIRVGDTLTSEERPASEPLPGYVDVKPMVFAGLFPTDADQYQELRDALERLKLNDGSLMYEPETSQALGFGFRCGFLGLLHMDVVRERLEREFDLDLLVTPPNVAYEVHTVRGEEIEVHNPAQMPDANGITEVLEPYVKATVIVPKEFVGTIMGLAEERRGTFDHMEYLSETRVQLIYQLPLSEIVLDFYDQLKSRTRGYASFDYELDEYRASELVKLDILLAGEPVDALSLIVHRDKAYASGKLLVERLRALIPRQMFDVPVQASIGSRIIARETIKAKRKDVLSKCYGGDVTRKRKLLEKQKKGKKRMKQVGSVEVPQEAFLAVLSLDEDASPDLTRVAVIGHVEWLELGVGREQLVPGGIVNIEAEYTEPAGGGGVAVRSLPALGASHTRFYTALGNDENARRSEEILTADGVEVCAARRDRPQNRAYTVVDPTGERTIFVRGENDHPTLDDDLPWDDLTSFDGVFYTGDDPGSLHAARRAKVVVVTARRFDSLVESGVEVDVLIGSSSDVNEQVDLSRLRAKPRIVARTAGARGGTYTLADGTTGSWSSVPPPGPIVDTYGAGDVFMAALTLALGRGDRLDDALAFGARSSAAQLTRRAGSPR